jgi:hypothetical protein
MAWGGDKGKRRKKKTSRGGGSQGGGLISKQRLECRGWMEGRRKERKLPTEESLRFVSPCGPPRTALQLQLSFSLKLKQRVLLSISS